MIRRFFKWFRPRRRPPVVIRFPSHPIPIKGMETVDWSRVNAWGQRNAEMIAAAQARCQKVQIPLH